jgi:hypothetical protein
MTTASTATSYEQQGLLHHMFTRQAKSTPEKIAIVEESGKQITFSDLDEKSDLLGRHLVHTGVTPNACVGMYLNKSIEYTTAYIAILKAGGYIFISFFYLFIRNSSGFMHGEQEPKLDPINHIGASNIGVSPFLNFLFTYLFSIGRDGRNRMVVGFTTTCASSAYHC